MPSRVENQIKTLVDRYPEQVMNALLARPYWPQEVRTQIRYVRISDDNHGVLSVAFSPDGDGWVDVFAKPDPHEPGSMRFRTSVGGGGSPHTRNALLMLAAAMRLDELEHPQDASKLDLGPIGG